MAQSPGISSDLLMAHAGFVRSLARSLLSDEAEVEDVVQETFLRAIEAGPDRKEALPGWLRAVTRNLAFKRLRSRARVRAREEEAARSERLPSAAELVERETSLQRVVAAVLDLPEHYRQVVMLRYFEDLPPRRIAARLDQPVSTVRMRLHRALKQLRSKLDREYGGDRDRWSRALGLLAGLPDRGGVAASSMASSVALWGAAAAAAAALLLWGAGWLRFGSPSVPAVQPPLAVGTGADVDRPDPSDTGGRVDASGAALTAGATDAAGRGSLSLDVLVVDAAGEPASGAEVLGEWGRAGLVPRARTDDAGHARLSIPRGPGSVQLAARAAGHGPTAVAGWSGGESIVLRLRPDGARITGRVVDPDGQPLAGVQVQVGESYRLGMGHLGALDLDPVGNVGPLLPGLTLRAEGRAAYQAVHDVHGFLGPQCLDADGVVRRLPPAAVARTDARGGFSLEGLEPGGQPVHLSAAGHAPRRLEVTLGVGEATDLEIELAHAARLSGVLRRADGLPLEGGFVYALNGDVRRGTPVDAEGFFTLDGLPAGPYALYAQGSGGSATAERALGSGEHATWKPELDDGGALRGRLVDHEDRALAGWRIELRLHWNPSRAVARTTTAADGRFTLPACPPVEAALHLFAPGAEGATPTRVRPVAAGDGLDPWRVPRSRLETGRLSGRVLGPDGRPLPVGTPVLLLGEGHDAVLGPRLDADGRFTSTPLPGGEWRWILPTSGLCAVSEHPVVVDGGDRDLGEVRLEAPATLTLDGEPATVALRLTRVCADGARVTAFDGRARVPADVALAPGRWEVAFPCASDTSREVVLASEAHERVHVAPSR